MTLVLIIDGFFLIISVCTSSKMLRHPILQKYQPDYCVIFVIRLVVALASSSKRHQVVDLQRVLIGYCRFLTSCYPPVFPAHLWNCSNDGGV